MTPEPLFTKSQIDVRVNELAREIASTDDPPGVAAPILAGAFVFAADLLRALAIRGLSLPVEFLWLRSYTAAREPSERVTVLVSPGQAVKGAHALLIDGVLDLGRTLDLARHLLLDAGARRVTTVVAVDKRLDNAVIRADYAAFTHVNRFIVGYGMDDGGQGRALPYIGTVS